jgi:hypothetical protein
MLDYKKNRLDYGKQISPPEGFVLDRAVATTYSLDLISLLSIPVALIYSRNMDDKGNWMNLFDSLQKTSDKLKVYYQASKIHVPNENNQFVTFIEDSITGVIPKTDQTSFHPKIWVIRYKGQKNQFLYRFIVLSRNLTFDRSWDIAFYLEGYTTKKIQPQNKSLCDYIKHLSEYSDFEDSKRFIKDLEKVDFHIEDPFNDFEFFPMGFKRYNNPLANESFEDLIIVSPFIDEDTLTHFTDSSIVNGRTFLFSRKEELDKIGKEVLDLFEDVYVFSSRVVEGEEDIDILEEDEVPLLQNLHAKLYIGRLFDGTTSWYLGSANCSRPAMERNEEFLIKLNSNQKNASVDTILDNLLSKTDDLLIFEPYERERKEAIESNEFDFRLIIHELLTFLNNSENYAITCIQNVDKSDHFDIKVVFNKQFDFNTEALKISLASFSEPKNFIEILQSSIVFKNIALQNISPFFIWKIEHLEKDQRKEFVLKMEFDIPAGRQEAIIKEIFENKDKFLQFIQFLLGKSADDIGLPNISKGAALGEGIESSIWNTEAPLFEEMLLASSREPEKLKEIQSIINKLEDTHCADVIPDEFKKLWSAFKQLI